jgi:hypothetical protein
MCRRLRRYGPSDFQYLAACIIPRDLWYIILFALVIGRTTLLLRPDDPPDNEYERYREAWHLLREVPPPIDPEHPPAKMARYKVPGFDSENQETKRNGGVRSLTNCEDFAERRAIRPPV